MRHKRKKKAIYIESLAIREAIKYWRFWLIGRKFSVITDHKPLENLNLRSRTDEELGDLANYLLQYDFEIIYRPGAHNAEADCLSRNPVLDSEHGSEEIEILPNVNLLTIEDIRESQKHIAKIKSDELKNSIILRKKNGRKRIALDKEYGERLIDRVHLRFGHIGPKHINNTIRKYFYFDRMSAAIRNYCSSCTVCIKNKSRRTRKSGPLGHLGPAMKPFEIMSLDTIGGFGGKRSTKKYLHLLVDHFTRYAYVSASHGQSATEMIKLVESVHKDNPIGTLLTDQYGGLNSVEFSDYVTRTGIEHIFTAVDTPSSNGLNERLNQTLTNRIRCKINETEKKIAWTSIAKSCVNEYNETVHSVTGFAPNYLMNGTLVNIVPQGFLEIPDLGVDRQKAFENSLYSHNANKNRVDQKREKTTFSVVDLVFVENGNKLNRHKLDEIRVGPYPIIRQLSNTVFELDINHKGNTIRRYHISKMIKAT